MPGSPSPADQGVDVGVRRGAVEHHGPSRRATTRSASLTVVSSWVATSSAAPSPWARRNSSSSASRPGAVEADERLVDEQQLERADEGERDRRLLAQAAAERRRQVVGPVGEPDDVEEVGGVLLPVVGVVQAGDVLEVLPHAEVVVEHRLVAEVGRARRGPRSSRRRGRARRRSRPSARAARRPSAATSSCRCRCGRAARPARPCATSRSTGPTAGASPYVLVSPATASALRSCRRSRLLAALVEDVAPLGPPLVAPAHPPHGRRRRRVRRRRPSARRYRSSAAPALRARAAPAIVLTAIGQSRRSVDVNPANSGGTAADDATGGASGSGASRTMLTTAPPTPTHVTGRHRASAAAQAWGSPIGDGGRAEQGERHERDGRVRRGGGRAASPAAGARRRCGRGGRSPATAARRRRGRAGTARRRRRRAPASCRGGRRRRRCRRRSTSTRHAHEPGDRVAQQPVPAAAPHRRRRGRPAGASAADGASDVRRGCAAVRRAAGGAAARPCAGPASSRRSAAGTRGRPAARAPRRAADRRRGRRPRRGRATTATPTRSTGSWRMPQRARLPIASPGPGNHPAIAAPWAASTTTASAVASQRGTRPTWTSTATATNAAPVSGAGRRHRWPPTPPASRAAAARPAGRRCRRRARRRRPPSAAAGRRGGPARRGAGPGPAGGGGRRAPRPTPVRRRCRCAGRGRRPRRRPNPSTAGPWSRTSATWAGVAGLSVTSPLSQSTTPPPTSAARYTR